MSVGQVMFSVVTHFNFDIAQAMVGSSALTNSVNGISQAAINAQSQLQNMSVGLLAGMGYIPASIMGAVGYAIKAAEGWEQSKLSWANVISANADNLVNPITTMQERLEVAEDIMTRIYKTANEFGIDGKELESFSKTYTTEFLAKGLGGDDPEGLATTFARNLLKSAPNLNLDPMNVASQIQRSIEGAAQRDDPFFRRLAMETPAMGQFTGKGGAQRFNAMEPEKRVKTLNEALNHFAKDTEITTARMNSMTGQMNILKNNMMSTYSILRPIGEVMRILIVGALKFINQQIDGPLRNSFISLGKIAKILAPDIESAALSLRHMQRYAEVVSETKSTLHMVAMAEGVLFGWMTLTKIFPGMAKFTQTFLLSGVTGIGRMMWAAAGLIVPAFKFILPMLPIFGKLLMWVGTAILGPTMAIMFFLDIIKRAKGIAELRDIKALLTITEKFTKIGASMANSLDTMFGPISDGMNWWAEQIAWIFTKSDWMNLALTPLEGLGNMMDKLATKTISLYAAIGATGAWFGYFTQMLWDAVTGEKRKNMDAKEVTKIWEDAFDEAHKKMLDKMNNGKLAVKHHTKIDKVVIENKFKENLEPDRIAFTIRDQLLKVSANATQGRAAPMFPTRGR